MSTMISEKMYDMYMNSSYGIEGISTSNVSTGTINNASVSTRKVAYNSMWKRTKIKNVIFNDPATIVFWSDGTKTVVKCGENDIYDPEKGLAMAVAKKYLGTNKSHSNYMDEFKKWLPKEEELSDPFPDTLSTLEDFRDSIKKLAEIGKSLNEGEK